MLEPAPMSLTEVLIVVGLLDRHGGRIAEGVGAAAASKDVRVRMLRDKACLIMANRTGFNRIPHTFPLTSGLQRSSAASAANQPLIHLEEKAAIGPPAQARPIP